MNKIINKVDVDGWPGITGRYKVGDVKSCVAVCTLYDLDLVDKINYEKIAIGGKVVTENIGVERIIQNTLANPNIRFLILCGEEPHGHWVGQALQCIMEKGIDGDGRIIGAKGAMPYVKNVSKEEIEAFKKQIKIVDLIDCKEIDKINAAIDDCIKNDPGAFKGKRIEVKEVEKMQANFDHEKEMKMDEKGWFVINLDRDKKEIVVEHHMGYGKEAKLHAKIVGKTVEEISGTLVKLGLISDLYHATYVGKELQKAEIALKTGKEYEQEKDLDF